MSETADKAMELVKQLAEKFGTSVEYLWPRVVAHKQAESYCQVAAALVAMLIVLALWKWVWPKVKNVESGDDRDAAMIGFVVVVGLASVASTLSLIITIANVLPDAIAPEGAVVMEIIKGAK